MPAEIRGNIIDQRRAGCSIRTRNTAARGNRLPSAARRFPGTVTSAGDRPQLLLGAYQALGSSGAAGRSEFRARDAGLVVVVEARDGIITATWWTGNNRIAVADACSGPRRLKACILSFHERQRIERHSHPLWRVQAAGAFANPCFTHDPSHLHSGVGRASVEADVDERSSGTTDASGFPQAGRRTSAAQPIPAAERDY